MHSLAYIVKQVNRTHKGLGPLIAANLLAAKAKKCILNIAPAGCGKSTATDALMQKAPKDVIKEDKLSLAGLKRVQSQLYGFDGTLIIDDLAASGSPYMRVATITALATITYSHRYSGAVSDARIVLEGFYGSTHLNIQPAMIDALVLSPEWIGMVRDKVIRWYHLIRPIKPKARHPRFKVEWGPTLHEVQIPKYRGKLWWQLYYNCLTQWSAARCNEHIPTLLKAAAALDGREKVNVSDYYTLIKLLKPMVLERYIIKSYGFELGRSFNHNVYCILVELASWGNPTIGQVAYDYGVHPTTVERLVAAEPDWCFIKANTPRRIYPSKQTQQVFKACGIKEKW